MLGSPPTLSSMTNIPYMAHICQYNSPNLVEFFCKCGYSLAKIEGGGMMSLKRDNFVRLAESRVSRAIDSMRVIGNLSNRSNYEYTEEDARKIIATLQAELNALKAQFKPRGMSAQGFKLKK
jgi:hypothetical protein